MILFNDDHQIANESSDAQHRRSNSGLAVVGGLVEFSTDETTQRILREYFEFERQKKEANEKRATEFEGEFHETYCLLPRRSTSGKWTWLAPVYVRYKAIKRAFLEVKANGALQVTDVVSHYIVYQYERGAPLEVLTKEEYEKVCSN